MTDTLTPVVTAAMEYTGGDCSVGVAKVTDDAGAKYSLNCESVTCSIHVSGAGATSSITGADAVLVTPGAGVTCSITGTRVAYVTARTGVPSSITGASVASVTACTDATQSVTGAGTVWKQIGAGATYSITSAGVFQATAGGATYSNTCAGAACTAGAAARLTTSAVVFALLMILSCPAQKSMSARSNTQNQRTDEMQTQR